MATNVLESEGLSNRVPYFLIAESWVWMEERGEVSFFFFWGEPLIIIELGCGNGASKDILNNKNILLTDIQKYPWISKKVDMVKLNLGKKYLKKVKYGMLISCWEC